MVKERGDASSTSGITESLKKQTNSYHLNKVSQIFYSNFNNITGLRKSDYIAE